MPDQSDESARVLVQLKSNLGPLARALRLSVRDSGGSPTIDWLGEITGGRELASVDSQPTGALAEAVYVLYSLLGEGPLLAEEVLAHARSNGISTSTLRRAKTILGVASQRRGFGRGSEFFWHLPAEPHPVIEQLRGQDLDLLSDQLFDGSEVPVSSERSTNSQRSAAFRRRVLGPETPPTRPENEQDDGGMGTLGF